MKNLRETWGACEVVELSQQAISEGVRAMTSQKFERKFNVMLC